MSTSSFSRRNALKTGLAASLGLSSGLAFSMDTKVSRKESDTKGHNLPFRVSLNTSTLMAYELPVDQQIDLIAGAGFDGTELWMRDIQAYLEKGGSRAGLREKLEAGNLVLENIIGFSNWCHDDPEERKKALEVLRQEMEIIADLGGGYIATPVMGMTQLDPANFDAYAERYRAILELGDQTGVYPLLELWGMGALHKVSDCAQITIASGHPKAAMLLDIYHVHRGGNTWDTVDVLNGGRMPVIHMNDYPATPAWNELTDGDRVLPGEGSCPFGTVIPKLYHAGFRGGFSVELFNQGYWAKWDAAEMLAQSYACTVEVLRKAMEGVG
ncbi:sugar phosphate isomerase/epimerase family protein [Robiginitalea sediminis]|uniref:sugar phosphate isomerase/epimerase family protein n=1 Tax=Robiginitalea sediminis TaxID=1982593 RepID=UPI000B4B74F5|nr:sugar phosphate isomerase/epimerase [Robiginitalea sediminis]